jgi:anti-anti-sigma regulatory factor
MDMRARLLFAFVPLMILLLLIAIVLPVLNNRFNQLITARLELTADMLRSEDLVKHIVLQHDAVTQYVGGSPGALDNVLRERAAVSSLLELETEREDANQSAEQRIASLYSSLDRRHGEAIGLFQTNDREGAARAFRDSRLIQLLDAIVDLGDEGRVVSSAALANSDQELRRFQSYAGWFVAIGTAAGFCITLLLASLLIGQVVRPLNRLSADAEQFAAGERSGKLSEAGNIAQVQRLRTAFQQLIDANAERQYGLQTASGVLQQQVAREEQLRATVNALSVPVIPLANDTLLLPLVGYLDEARAAELTSRLLEAIRARRARVVVLDITGLAHLDEDTVERLHQAIEAARLLGTRVTLVGVRADQALALTALNLGAAGVSVAGRNGA